MTDNLQGLVWVVLGAIVAISAVAGVEGRTLAIISLTGGVIAFLIVFALGRRSGAGTDSRKS